MAARDGGSARRRRERRLRSRLRHERMTVRMELTAALHHSAPKSAGPETYDAPRSQKTVNSKEDAVLFELFDEDTAGWRSAPLLEPKPQDLAAPPEGRRLYTVGAGPRCPSAAADGLGAEHVHPGGARGSARSSRTSAATFWCWCASGLWPLGRPGTARSSRTSAASSS